MTIYFTTTAGPYNCFSTAVQNNQSLFRDVTVPVPFQAIKESHLMPDHLK